DVAGGGGVGGVVSGPPAVAVVGERIAVSADVVNLPENHLAAARHEHMALVLARVVVDGRDLLQFGGRRGPACELDDRDIRRRVILAVERVTRTALIAE